MSSKLRCLKCAILPEGEEIRQRLAVRAEPRKAYEKLVVHFEDLLIVRGQSLKLDSKTQV